MSVIVEFTVAPEEFLLGQVLTASPDVRIELERIVPTGPSVLPFLWVQGEDFETFERQVRENGRVAEFVALDRLDDEVLYRIEWTTEPHSLLEGINAAEGAILEAFTDGRWKFRLRFPAHDAVSQFYNFCTEQDITIHIDRTYTLTERTGSGKEFGLTEEQRRALVLALDRGYFETPSQTSLGELADYLGISQQALSDRIRRGNEKVLREALL